MIIATKLSTVNLRGGLHPASYTIHIFDIQRRQTVIQILYSNEHEPSLNHIYDQISIKVIIPPLFGRTSPECLQRISRKLRQSPA